MDFGPFKGIGNLFRQYSQYHLMKKWEGKYHFHSALEAPYDLATDGIDGNIFSCPHNAYTTIDGIPAESYDLVWNFGFLQRGPSLIRKMKKISKRYIAAFAPNYLNPGTLVHKLYHQIHGGPCIHPERGDPKWMTLRGLTRLFEASKLQILESGYIDLPPFPDTVVTIKQFFFGEKERVVLKIPIDVRLLLPFERIAFPKWIIAHHCYVLAEKCREV